MVKRVKWPPVVAVAVSAIAVVLGVFGSDAAVSVPAGLLGVTLGLVSRDG